MVVIRRMIDRHRAYTAIFLPGEPPKIFPTSDQEHARVLQIYKQDRPHAGICNDFSDYALGSDTLPAPRRSHTKGGPVKARLKIASKMPRRISSRPCRRSGRS